MLRGNWFILLTEILLIVNSVRSLNRTFSKRGRYQVAVHDGVESFCGGSILSEKYVLSAAKCFKPMGDTILGPIYVFAGSTKFVNAGTGAAVEEIYIPEMFSCLDKRCHPADIAMLRLRGRLRLEADLGIVPISLPKPKAEDDEYEMYEFETATATGYCPHDTNKLGNDPTFDLKDRFYPGVLMSTKVDVLQQHECEYAWLGVTEIYSSQMCAKPRKLYYIMPLGVCSDHPGYGLVHNNTLIGVASFGKDACHANDDCTGYPTVYTRVVSYLWFIEDAMNDRKDFHVRSFKINQYNDYNHSGADALRNYTSPVINYFILLSVVFKVVTMLLY